MRCWRGSVATAVLCVTMLASSPACSNEVRPERWQADLQEMVQQLSERHVDLYHSVSKEEFQRAVDELDRAIPTLSRPEILVRFAQLLAMVGDGHTSMYPGNQKKWWFHHYPLKLWQFADGMYVIAAPANLSHLFGKRLLQIDDTSIDEAFRRISTTIGADNDKEYVYTVPFEMVRPEILHVLGIARSPDQAEFVFEGDVRETVQAITLKQWRALDWRSGTSLYGGQAAPSQRLEFQFATPLTLPHLQERKYYWYTYLEDERTLFLQYNVCWNQKNRPPFKEVVDEMLRYIDNGTAERLIVDLRNNTGGEPMIAEPLVQGLADRPAFGEQGRLFVLVSRRTFSAALTNAAHLRSRAGARIVGEAPRGKPNSPSEGRDIDLKRVKVWVTVSTQFVERDPALGDADYLPVDIEANPTYAQYQQAQDPVFEAALAAELHARATASR